jgi:GxxExxY protein
LFEDLNPITKKIIACAFKVSNSLGAGFLERVYENALAIELKRNGLTVEQQKEIVIRYDGFIVGEYFADLVIENKVIIEIKAVKAFDQIHMAQCLNYLRATKLPLALLINFGSPKVQVKRIVGAVN